MKIFYLLILLSFLFYSCEKGCTDANAVNYDASADQDNGTCQYKGKAVFWMNTSSGYNDIDVKVNGTMIGTITVSHASTPDCDANGTVTYTDSPGAYAITANEQFPGTGSWSGIVNITSKGCTTYELK